MVHEVELPPQGGSLIFLRFTRVPFGLSASPFTLGGPMWFLLRNSGKFCERDAGQSVRRQSFLAGAETAHELRKKSEAARSIISDMAMNLREFLPNSRSLKDTDQKSKGTKNFLASNSRFLSNPLQISKRAWTTKRTITQQIASIYDSLGWLVPLMVLPKQLQ